MTDGRTTITIYGKVAYDVENAEWVMWVDDRFVPMEGLYAGINGELRRRGLPPLKVGDEISLEVKRSSGQEKGNAI
ncbi:hypothetical protein LJK88_40310 [Paenibacillus sp. P26]|nr:hypothetical protein LJK88_40310 [Paenibacillus sp. P26]UUZ92912.1 hypothetical protein LJK87_48005 [Paenibacillus sp. P25]